MEKHSKVQGILLMNIILVLLTVTGCNQAISATPAQQASRDLVLEQAIETQLQGMNPAALPIYREATQALDAGEFDKARELYTRVTSLAPDFSVAYRRLGNIEGYYQNYEEAVRLSRKAIELEPNAYNQTALARALLGKNSSAEYLEAYSLAYSASQTLTDDEVTTTVWLMAAASTDNLLAVRQADERLLQINPNNPIGHYFAGAIAAIDRIWLKAERELLLAQKLGFPQEEIKALLDEGIARYALLLKLLIGGGVALVIWLAGLGALYLSGNILSKATLKALRSTQPSLASLLTPGELKVRSIYRKVIVILSMYFYISIPFVILLLFVIVGGLFYIFSLIQTIPIYLAWVLIVMLFGSLIAILRALFSQVKVLPPGRALERMDAPELWNMVESVARKLGARPVDAIYLTPGVEIGVYEQGSILRKMRGTGKRNLILGMGSLPGLTQGQLAATLAHEYGHFSNQDTAGGNLAHQVHASLYQMAQRLIQIGATQFYNPVWQFVMGYQRIFLRVTLGASRLQEILADRFAARAFGGTNCIEGLQSLTRQGIVFPMQANFEIKRSREENRPIVNLYVLPVQDGASTEITSQYEQAMQRTTSPYDSHPALGERIALIEQLGITYSPVADNPRPALELLSNAEQLQREMTAEITKHLPTG